MGLFVVLVDVVSYKVVFSAAFYVHLDFIEAVAFAIDYE